MTVDLAASPLTHWNGPHDLPDYAAIRDEDFEPVIRAAFKAHLAEIDAIASDPAEPTWENTIEALEKSGEALSRVSAIFFNRAGSHTNDTIREVERTVSPLYARHRTEVAMNKPLFERVDALWQKRDSLGLTTEQLRVLERRWKGFVRSGAALAVSSDPASGAAQAMAVTAIRASTKDQGRRVVVIVVIARGTS